MIEQYPDLYVYIRILKLKVLQYIMDIVALNQHYVVQVHNNNGTKHKYNNIGKQKFDSLLAS